MSYITPEQQFRAELEYRELKHTATLRQSFIDAAGDDRPAFTAKDNESASDQFDRFLTGEY